MNVEKMLEGGNLIVKVEGRMDTVTAPQVDEELKASIDGAEKLTMDFTGLEYISSAGLRVLLSAQKIMNRQGSMEVIGVSDAVMEIFEVTGFSDILTIR